MTYQLTVLVSNKLDEKARQGVLDVVNKDLGNKVESELWGVRGLAYPIKHEEKAFYAHYNFEAEPNEVPALDRKLKLNEDIIRYLLIKVDAKDLVKAEKKTAKTVTKKVEKTETEEPSTEEETTTSEESAE